MSTKVNTTTLVSNTSFVVRPDVATDAEINGWNMNSSETGTIVYNSDTNELNIYNGNEWISPTDLPIKVEYDSLAESGPNAAVWGKIISTLSGAYSMGTYGESYHEGELQGKYNYGAYNKAEMKGTGGYQGVLYGSYNEARYSGSDDNGNNASWSSVYGVQAKAKVTGGGDLGYVIGNNVSAEHGSANADVQWLQGQHTTIKHTDGTVSGNIAVTLLDYDGGSGTVAGDFAYLQIQGDGNPASGVNGVAGQSRAINSDSALPSSFSGEIFAEGFRVNAMQTPPATSTSTGEAGTVIVASDAIYVCTATDTWVKSALTTF